MPSDTGVLSRVVFNKSEVEISNDNPKPAGVDVEAEAEAELFIKELNIFTNGDTFEFLDRRLFVLFVLLIELVGSDSILTDAISIGLIWFLIDSMV